MFSPGDKVVAVERHYSVCPNRHVHQADMERAGIDKSPLISGRVYTIATAYQNEGDCETVTLVELDHDPGFEGWCAGRFRKLTKSTLTLAEMLDTPVVDVLVSNGA